jgi:hypothetical protein
MIVINSSQYVNAYWMINGTIEVCKLENIKNQNIDQDVIQDVKKIYNSINDLNDLNDSKEHDYETYSHNYYNNYKNNKNNTHVYNKKKYRSNNRKERILNIKI